MKINVAAKLKSGQWRAATVINNVFEDASVSDDLSQVLTAAFVALLGGTFVEGAIVALEINTTEPENAPAPEEV